MPTRREIREYQRRLNESGFPCGTPDGRIGPRTRSATRYFQRAFAGGRRGLPLLTISGKVNKETLRASKELPYLSKRYTWYEWRSKGNGTCYVRREILKAAERLSDKVGHKVRILSGYRDPAHNRRVGGASDSMHMYGLAFDPIEDGPNYNTVASWGIFDGIGYRGSNNRFRHGDKRGVLGRPDARWRYS